MYFIVPKCELRETEKVEYTCFKKISGKQYAIVENNVNIVTEI